MSGMDVGDILALTQMGSDAMKSGVTTMGTNDISSWLPFLIIFGCCCCLSMSASALPFGLLAWVKNLFGRECKVDTDCEADEYCAKLNCKKKLGKGERCNVNEPGMCQDPYVCEKRGVGVFRCEEPVEATPECVCYDDKRQRYPFYGLAENGKPYCWAYEEDIGTKQRLGSNARNICKDVTVRPSNECECYGSEYPFYGLDRSGAGMCWQKSNQIGRRSNERNSRPQCSNSQQTANSGDGSGTSSGSSSTTISPTSTPADNREQRREERQSAREERRASRRNR